MLSPGCAEICSHAGTDWCIGVMLCVRATCCTETERTAAQQGKAWLAQYGAAQLTSPLQAPGLVQAWLECPALHYQGPATGQWGTYLFPIGDVALPMGKMGNILLGNRSTICSPSLICQWGTCATSYWPIAHFGLCLPDAPLLHRLEHGTEYRLEDLLRDGVLPQQHAVLVFPDDHACHDRDTAVNQDKIALFISGNWLYIEYWIYMYGTPRILCGFTTVSKGMLWIQHFVTREFYGEPRSFWFDSS